MCPKVPLDSYRVSEHFLTLSQYLFASGPCTDASISTVRLAVHFQSVTDKFTPHDTVISLTAPTDLTETSLASANLLHAASGSITSSNSSLRQKRLAEIAEDREDGTNNPQESKEEPIIPAVEDKSEVERREKEEYLAQLAKERANSVEKAEPSPGAQHKSQTSVSTVAEVNRNFRGELDQSFPPPRKSSQSTRTTIRDVDGSYLYKPKVKLGPRPSLDLHGRPHTSGSHSRQTNDIRPISTLPAGVKLPARKTASTLIRPKSSGARSLHSSEIPPMPLSPLIMTPQSFLNSPPGPMSPRSIYSLQPKSPGTTPEKQRLMKALEIRKKQKAAKASKEQEQLEAERAASEDRKDKDAEPSKSKSSLDSIKEDLSSSKNDHTRDASVDTQPSTDQTVSMTSPSTIPDNSDGPSTQASSVAEEEEMPVTAMKDPDPVNHITNKENVEERDNAVTPDENHQRSESGTSNSESTVMSPRSTLDDGLEPQNIIANITPIAEPPTESIEHHEDCLVVDPPVPSLELARTEDAETRPSSADSVEIKRLQRKEKRKGIAEDLKALSSADNSDDNMLSDDSFLEELGSATVHEAKSMLVSKSPILPSFPDSVNQKRPNLSGGSLRSVSSPLKPGSTPGSNRSLPDLLSPGRSVSTNYAHSADGRTSAPLVAKKVTVSNGISNRIKALEKISARDSGLAHPTTAPVKTEVISAAGSLRARHSKKIGRPKNPAERAQASRSPSNTLTSTESSPTSIKSHYQTSPRQETKTPDSSASPVSMARPESISVTARIVRNASDIQYSPNTDPSEPVTLNLHQSPLVIDHERAMSPSTTSSYPTIPTHVQPDNNNNKDVSLPSSPEAKRNSFGGLRDRRNLNQRISVSRGKSDTSLPKSASEVSISSIDGDHKEEKKDSRRMSRLMKRMSTGFAASRKSLVHAISPTLQEEDPMQTLSEASPQTPNTQASETIDIGDVNVQFPDTLLWKRRFVCIDQRGFLVFSPSKLDDSARFAVTKRFHMSELRQPYLPDLDMQELPNSVLVEIKDGGALQCACESRQGQGEVLEG